jgi:sugar lactone lactonase YvrE
MRGIAFSLLSAAILSACASGPRATQEPTVSASPELLSIERQVHLNPPLRPLGNAPKLATAPDGDIYILDPDHHRVLHYGQDGRLQREAGGLGDGPLEFNTPVDFDTDGLSLWVLDRQNRRLVRLDLDLNYIEQLSLAPAEGDLSAPLWYDAVSCAQTGDVFLLDRREPRVIRISQAGEQLASYGGFGLGDGRLTAPVDLAVEPDGVLWVADGNRLMRYNRSGNFERAHSFPESITAVAAGKGKVWAVSSRGSLWSAGLTHSAKVIFPDADAAAFVATAVTRDGRPAMLDGNLTVWLTAADSDSER